MPEDSEFDRLDPQPSGPITLSSGLEVVTVPMRTRQMMRLMRILTHGAGGALLAGAMDFSADPGEFITRLSAVALMAIPDAEDETIQFIASMCEPVGIVKPAAPGQDQGEKVKEANDALYAKMNTELYNPDPIDTIDIIERIIQTEGADLQALGRRLGKMMRVFLKTGQDKQKTEETPLPGPQELAEKTPETASSAPSPPSSTPSAPSTAGPTSTSSDSPSAGSVPLAPPSVLAGHPEMSATSG